MASRGPDKKIAASIGVSLEDFDDALLCFENAFDEDGCSASQASAKARELMTQTLPMIRLLDVRADTLWTVLVEAMDRKQVQKAEAAKAAAEKAAAKKKAEAEKGKQG